MNAYDEICNRITEQLENGEIPWRKPWVKVTPYAVSHKTLRPYSLLNQLVLDRPGEYLTFKQVTEEGGRVKKGAKARFVTFWKLLDKKDGGEADETTDSEDKIPFLRYYLVFHVDDCEGITPRMKEDLPNTADPIERAEDVLHSYLDAEGIKFTNEKGNTAGYCPATDSIVMPLMAQFTGTAEYYSAAFHEAAHSTGIAKRLHRYDSAGKFGSEAYSKEELVAEITSAIILHEIGIETPQSFKNSTAYCQSWLKALQNDKRMIVSAASRAEKAANMILNAAVNGALTPEEMVALIRSGKNVA